MADRGNRRGRGPRGSGGGGARGGSGDRGGARGGSGDRGGTRGGSGDRGGARGGSGDRGGGFRGDRGGGFRGDRGGGFRGDRGGGFRGDRGGRGGFPENRQTQGGPPQQGQTFNLAMHAGPPSQEIRPGIYDPGATPAPDADIKVKENAQVQATNGRIIAGLPSRRSFGTKGRQIILRTNYFRLLTAFDDPSKKLQDKPLYKYNVDMPQLSKDKRRRMMDVILNNHRFKDVHLATDNANIIVTTTKLDLGPTGEWKDKATIPPPPENTQASDEGPTPDFVQAARDRNCHNFKVVYQTSFSLQQIINFLNSASAAATYAGTEDVVQLLNIIIGKGAANARSVATVGQNNFFPYTGHPGVEGMDLGAGLLALRGYFASVRPSIGRLLVNINVTSGAFYKPMPLMQLIWEANFGRLEDTENFIRMLKVKANYKKDGENQAHMTKVKTIVSFARDTGTVRVLRFGNAKQVSFKFTDRSKPNAKEQDITVFDYFKRERGITLQYPNEPVLNVGTRTDPQYLPMEICEVMAGQPYRKLLGGDQTAKMIRFAARAPNQNAMSIAGDQNKLGNGTRLFRLTEPNANPQASGINLFGFGANTNMLTVPGRILEAPNVSYGNNKIERTAKGAWNLREVKFAAPGQFAKWSTLIINRPGRYALMGDTVALFNVLAESFAKYGIRMGQKLNGNTIQLETFSQANRAVNDNKLRTAFNGAAKAGISIILIVLPEADKWVYARIKYWCDVEFGIHTVCAVGSKLQKQGGQEMFMGNLALKFNIKGGGVNHRIPNTLTNPLDNNTMLIGIDVTHPSPGSSAGAPSIAAMVASVDEHLCQWPGSIRTQAGRVEMVGGIKEMLLERLDLWRKKHQNRLPSKIVLYRDGVSEGQYQLVLEQELPPMQEAFKERYGDQKNWPKMTILIVGKRHHTRFYPTSQEDADYDPQKGRGSWNPKPGTVVDRGIVGKVLHEFYLQAHQGLQGTAKPAHYVVIKDEIGFQADDFEQFTLKLCYLFNRATKAVSICPPAYYADLLCERGRAYLHSVLQEDHGSTSAVSAGSQDWTRDVHPRLQESTWYI